MLPLLPYTQRVSAKGMATFLYVCQVLSALLCLTLSVWRLVSHDFLAMDAGAPDSLKGVVEYSLYAFYAMALVEAFVFLVEKMYWEYKISYQRLFERVDTKAQLKSECVDTIRSFFYQVTCPSDEIFAVLAIFSGFGTNAQNLHWITLNILSFSMSFYTF